MTDPVTIQLTKPIKNAKAEEVSELTFRPLTAGDIRKCGHYQIFNTDTGEMRFNTEVLAAMISATGNLPKAFIDDMAPQDFDQACGVMLRFLTGTPPPGSST
jgi:hypothetical protein